MSSQYGKHLKITIDGASHAFEIGVHMEGIPAGLAVDLDKLQCFLNRRAPGRHPWSTPRKEADIPRILSGLTHGRTNGEPLHAIIFNENIRRSDYDPIQRIPRPGHADFTAWMKYGLDFDMSGGGPFSGRMTAPLCIAGGLCKQWLEGMGIRIGAHIAQIGCVVDYRFDPLSPNLDGVQQDFPVLSQECGGQMQEAIEEAKKQGDSLGGIIECAIVGLPIGIGGAMFDGAEGKIAQAVYGIPAVKGVEFGLGFDNATYHGSKANDPFYVSDGVVRTVTNNSGGILGGITTGMPLIFRVAVKPTPSIAQEQHSIDLRTMGPTTTTVKGRHDPCIVPRAVPVVEAAAAIAIYDMILENNQ